MKVVVGVSGGIDSFFTTKLLLSKGFDVSIFTYKFWQWRPYYDVTERINKISNYLKVDAYISETADFFYKSIVKPFIDEYISGRTPSPCVYCNSEIKFKLLYEYSQEKNIDFIATGHYAKIKFLKNRYYISRGVDNFKDQSYFLWKLPQEYLKKLILVLGEYKKIDVKNNITDDEKKILDKCESNEVCFLGRNKYWEFLENQCPEIKKSIDGNMVYNNKIVGKHNGYYHFTIGQRKGINIALGAPVYVKNIDPETNTVFLCDEQDLYSSEFTIKNVNYQKYENIVGGFKGSVKVRYRGDQKKCRLYKTNCLNRILVKLDEPIKAITPGQSAVVYEEDDIVLGGIIV